MRVRRERPFSPGSNLETSVGAAAAMDSDISGELASLERAARKGEGDSKAFSEESQAILRNQRSMIDKLKGDNEQLKEELNAERKHAKAYDSVSAQALVTVAVFVAISFAMLVLNVSGVWLSYRKAEEERESKRFEKAMNDLRGIKSEGQGSNRVSPEPIDSGWGEAEGGSPRKERVRDNAML